MISILAVIHIILSVFLVLLVLIQDPKGGSVGGMFGGRSGSDSLFGATGAPTFLARLTRWVAVVFATSCIAMTIFIKPKSGSVLDTVPIPGPKATDPDESEKETNGTGLKTDKKSDENSSRSEKSPEREVEQKTKSTDAPE